MEQHTSRKSKVKLGTGQSASDIFISTKVTKTGRKNQDGSPIFTTEVIRYPSANSTESDGVVIATGSNEDGAPKISKTANITSTEERFLKSKITEVRRQQMDSISSNFNLNAEEQKAYAESGGTDRNPISQSQSNTDGTDPQERKFDLTDETNRAVIKDAEGQRENYNDPNGGAWIYPTKLRDNGQDYIKFDIVQYEPRQFRLNSETGEILERRNELKTSKGTICLPIQPSITDMNTVDWNGLGVNPLDLGLTNFSMQFANGQGAQGIENIFEYMTSQATNNSALVNAGKLALAQKAASVTGLLSRVTGAVVNPNLELLFQGPQLRPFNFSFKLSPRNEDEARIVKGIIRAFKEAMAVKVASSQLFLKAPNVFEIKYVRGRTKDSNELDSHPSLNKIKTCALQACNVDYTPDGTYMTFADPSATMTSYNISLQFQELEPVTSKDYDKNYTEIGY